MDEIPGYIRIEILEKWIETHIEKYPYTKPKYIGYCNAIQELNHDLKMGYLTGEVE